MKIIKRLFAFVAVLALVMLVPYSCAQRGTPTGGPKDSIPPTFISAKPANFSTRFKNKTIRINFDEYIKLEKPEEQILISPPMEHKPIFKPMGIPAKYIEIELQDTLKENTTYSINFGRSIQDNNEGNELPFFKYVFSTGEYIDSLSFSGYVIDAFKRVTDEYISVLLYPLDDDYKDSIVYQNPPRYIAYTRDSTNSFLIENAKEGAYKMVALKDKNRNYRFDPKNEKIGFLTDTIHLPTANSYELTIFREIPAYKLSRPSQVSQQQYLFPFEGKIEELEINVLTDVPTDFEASFYKQIDHDSINYWFKPVLEQDTLRFEVVNREIRDTVKVALKEMDKDSLRISADPSSSLELTGNFRLSANTPLVKIDTSYIRLLNKDSLRVEYSYRYEREGNRFVFDFEKKEKEEYRMQALPGALTDFYGTENDTLNYKLSTKAETEYADLQLTILNIIDFPVIVQLTNERGETKRELIHHQEDGNVFKFKYVSPGKYYVRLIYDANDNGQWDTGDYLKKIQPETVVYMPELLEVRKNWEISQTYTIHH